MPDQIFGAGELRSTKNPRVGVIKLSHATRQFRYSAIMEGDLEVGIVEGDIVVARGHELQGIGVSTPGLRWPDRTVVYEIIADLPNPQRVTDAIAEWESRTVMKFKRRAASETNYVLFKNGNGCSSAVGRVGGVQHLTLGPQCSTGNAIHEIGHAVGLWHEQSRADRDQHVRVVWENIDPFFQHNFDQHITDGDDIGSYDYGSIMHYPKTAFALDTTKPTLVTPNGEEIGQRMRLSVSDIAAVAALYA